jgi:hypothetical protein
VEGMRIVRKEIRVANLSEKITKYSNKTRLQAVLQFLLEICGLFAD